MSNFIDLQKMFDDNPKLYKSFLHYICGRRSVIFDERYPGFAEEELFAKYVNSSKNKENSNGKQSNFNW